MKKKRALKQNMKYEAKKKAEGSGAALAASSSWTTQSWLWLDSSSTAWGSNRGAHRDTSREAGGGRNVKICSALVEHRLACERPHV